ncbi:MAG: sulfotransferase domain-containing protein [Alphaproteobacteria bacterium]
MNRDPRTLVWLASYPKSGNTWLRAFLANYFIDGSEPVSINEMQKISFGDSSVPAYADLGRCDPARLGPARIVALRERHLERISRNGEINFVKTHNAHVRIEGRWLIPAQLTRAAVYIIRDPRDMVLSYADHFALDPAAAAAAIASARNRVPTNSRTVMQFVGGWSGHVKSWTRTRDFPVLVLRYEDLLADAETCFARVLRLIGAPVDAAVLAQATRFSSFEVLAAQEQATGFREKGAAQARFFRRGVSGQWRDGLAGDIVERIAADHGAVMKRHGYPAR